MAGPNSPSHNPGDARLAGVPLSGNPVFRPALDSINPFSNLSALGNRPGIREAAKVSIDLLDLTRGPMVEVGRGTNSEIEAAYRERGGPKYISLEAHEQLVYYSNWRRPIQYPGDFLAVDPSAWRRQPVSSVVFWGCWETRGIVGDNWTIQFSAETAFHNGSLPFTSASEAGADAESRALDVSAGLLQRNGTILVTSMRYALHQMVMRHSPASLSAEYTYFKDFLPRAASAINPRELIVFGRTKESMLNELGFEFASFFAHINSVLPTPVSLHAASDLARDFAMTSVDPLSYYSSEVLDVEVFDNKTRLREVDLARLLDYGSGFNFLDSLANGAVGRIDAVAFVLAEK